MHNLPQFTEAFSLHNKLAVITGGGTGLGAAMAACMVAAGARVVITGRRLEVLEQSAARLGSNVVAEQHDVTHADGAEELMTRIASRHGVPTILVNNAGNHVKKTIEDHSISDFRSVLETHVEGSFSMTRAAAPLMRKQGGGSVLFITSMSALLGIPNVVAYSAAKAAYVGMVRALSSELGPDNVRVNGIAPGWIETPMLAQALNNDPERRQKILSRTPQRRFGKPEDIGWAAVYLCSPAAGFINGSVVVVDGGASIGF
ncbi:MAG: SDR family NAD(P)-dependent oxidoreductase [Acidobacteriota bacterium]